MERVVDDKIVDREKRVTYDLSEDELTETMKNAGFSTVKKISVKEEKHFDIWLAKKIKH